MVSELFCAFLQLHCNDNDDDDTVEPFSRVVYRAFMLLELKTLSFYRREDPHLEEAAAH